ncbi:MAG TPA: hypothetical protein VEM41_05835, partial [Actinomycetota bacterium]|nr:hypothetical protein [Actinomycetota bacterium]
VLVLGFLSVAAVAVVARPALAVTLFTVNSTGDGGDSNLLDNVCNDGTGNCTLRAAIQQANSSKGAQTIDFSIPVLPPPFTVPPVIKPATALPAVSGQTIIDGSSEPTVHTVILDGSVSTGSTGLDFTAATCTLRGFTVRAFSGIGVFGQAASLTVAGNIIGSVTGSGGNNQGIVSAGTGAIIGGTTAADRNVVSGNTLNGIVDENSGDVIEGNYIGTNTAGTAAAGNTQDGIDVYSSDATIGPGNVIAGNGFNGIEFQSSLAHDDVVVGNRIGTNAAGSAAVPNARNGVYVHGDANSIAVGASGNGNVISGNGQIGLVVVGATSSGDTAVGNLIGIDAGGTAAIPNEVGVDLIDVSGLFIGGVTPDRRNVISGNQDEGVLLQQVSGTATGNVVEGNYIGTNAAGTSAVPNAVGVHVVGADGNTIGGTSAANGNLISGNATDGVELAANATTVQENLIGTDATGASAVPNDSEGIQVFGSGNQIGGNVISGNPDEGVSFEGDGATGNALTGNLIGTNAAGTAAVPNGNGLFIDASDNQIGGDVPSARNVISGNSDSGIFVRQASSSTAPSANEIEGNYIGLSADGSSPLGNMLNGILVLEAGANDIGGTTPGSGNVISANGRGLYISTSTAGNVVYGNLIGTDASGTATSGLGNAGPGIRVEDTAGTTIGGTTSATLNVISGNAAEGIDLEGATKTQILGNFIGTDISGTLDRGNADDGILVNGSAKNTIGGTKAADANVISGNDGNGIHLDGKKSKSNNVQGNLIGTQKNGTSPLGNTGDGILVEGKAAKTSVGGTKAGMGNVIADNGLAGVFVDSGTGNAIRENSIVANGALGIDLHPTGVNPNDTGDPDKGANLGQNYPVVTSAVSSGGTTTVNGTLNSTPSATFQVDVFWSPTADSSGFGEGQTFLGTLSVTTNGSGNATFSTPFAGSVPAGSWVTMVATDAKGNTSEFSLAKKST